MDDEEQVPPDNSAQPGTPPDAPVEMVFGGGPAPKGKSLKTVKCETPGCPRADVQEPGIPIHNDTVQPIHCGGCGAVVHCDHAPDPDGPDEQLGGTGGAPVVTVTTRCQKCGTVMHEETRELEPVRIEDIPASILQRLGVDFAGKA